MANATLRYRLTLTAEALNEKIVNFQLSIFN
jgi:hypothetical protein